MKARTLVAGLALALIAGGAYLFWANRTPFAERPPAVGTKAPTIDLADTTGKMVHLPAFRGRPVIIYFWADWCPPCKDQLQVLQRVFERHEDRGVGVIGVALDRVPDGLVEAKGISFPLTPINDRVRKSYGNINNVPATFILDGDGFIVRKARDYPTAESLSGVLAALVPRDAPPTD